MTAYLTDLTFQLLNGAMKLSEQRKLVLQRFFRAAQTNDGGFAGYYSKSDIYYTAFSLRGLFLLGALDDSELLQSVSIFLEHEEKQEMRPIDLVSFLFSSAIVHMAKNTEFSAEQKNKILTRWKKFQREDGGFAVSEYTEYSSTYTTFLAAVSFEILDAEEEKQKIPVTPILARQCSDGGFTELSLLQRSGTNPTAAAIALLKMLGCELPNQPATINFLLNRQTPQGGFQAHTLIPTPDLLSSFTAVVALRELNAQQQYHSELLRNFLNELQLQDGGYCGSLWARQSDTEYTFYGLALESLLSVPSF
ncbi:MAG: terpene cyclase/mutase family protein [Planctomycetaceae bacterium]|jgi:geranylgeranyl transferase type-2 subunit beta|nr:terpene cyclase/mutase family protein [Planctomycetaceae bacterium]